MIPMSSKLNGREIDFSSASHFFKEQGFVIGDNWQYDHCYFDRILDPKTHSHGSNFLRIPAKTVNGQIDNDDATIRLGTPFVLTHEQYEPEDDDVKPRIGPGAVFDQFASPEEKDADTDPEWIKEAKSILKQTEDRFRMEFH